MIQDIHKDSTKLQVSYQEQTETIMLIEHITILT